MRISQRAEQLEPSVTLAASAKARALKAKGLDVLSLTVGEPDFTTPENIQAAAIRAIESGQTSYYKPSGGIPELKEAILERTLIDYGLQYDRSEVVVTDGAKHALYVLFQAILNPGDEVIIPVPYWVSYSEQVKLAGGTAVFVSSKKEDEFKINVNQLETVRSNKTQAVIINSPSNPTGSIYTEAELRAIGEWAVANDILIIADDIYGKLVYNGNHSRSIITLSDEIREQSILINGVSKTYAMTGWRIGYCIGAAKVIKAMTDIISQSTSNSAAVSQYAALEALTGSQASVEIMRQAFEERLNKVYPQIAALPGFSLNKPKGAFYLFPDVSGAMAACHCENVNDFVDKLLEEALVAVVTGAGFGSPHNIRLSYATDMATLEEAIKRIKAFLAKYMSN